MDEQDKQWQLEDDVRTIKQYNEIISDKDRFSKAIEELEKQGHEHLETVKAMNEYKEKIGFKKK